MLRFASSLLILGACLSGSAHAESLDALVKREEGIAFGVCALTPKPALHSEVHAVIPARFDTPGIWVTRTMLLVGVDEAKTVQGTLELKLVDDVPPREVVSVVCKANRLAIRLRGKTLSYTFDGKALRKAGGRTK